MGSKGPKVLVTLADSRDFRHLFSVLSGWLQIEIVIDRHQNGKCPDAQITFCRTSAEVRSALSIPARKRLILFTGGTALSHPVAVTFSKSSELPMPLCGQQLEQTAESTLPDVCTGEPLATAGAPVWTTLREGDGSTEFAVEALPPVQPAQLLFDQLQLPKWTGLIPLISFLGRIERDDGWIAPPLRACVMIDDPNLRWRSYGYVKYATLAQDSEKHGYHIAFATIPLDAWLVHPPTAALFRQHPAHLSLLVHGNNHTRNELARSYYTRTRQGLIAQSLKRIEHLERATHLEIPKIMAAPHSAFSEEFAGELLRQGYEAVCVSLELLRRYNQREWPVLFGLEPASFLSGLPIIPRFPVENGYKKAAILAAFLNQPLIPFGHHQDLAGDPSAVTQAIAFMEGLGAIKWCDPGQIARTNYSYRLSDNNLHLRMYSRHIEMSVTSAVQTVSVARPWLECNASELLEMRVGRGKWIPVDEGQVMLPGANGEESRIIEFRSVWPWLDDYHQIPSQSLQPWAIVRRMLTELRDRCYGSGG